jgi:hypothetical protein
MALPHNQQTTADNQKELNTEPASFFGAIEKQNLDLVQKMLEKDADVNGLSPLGTPLYRSVKLHNFRLLKLLVEHPRQKLRRNNGIKMIADLHKNNDVKLSQITHKNACFFNH